MILQNLGMGKRNIENHVQEEVCLLPCGGVEKNQWWVILCSVTLTLAVFSLSPVMLLATFPGSHIFPMGGGCQSLDEGEEGVKHRQPGELLCICDCHVCHKIVP